MKNIALAKSFKKGGKDGCSVNESGKRKIGCHSLDNVPYKGSSHQAGWRDLIFYTPKEWAIALKEAIRTGARVRIVP